MANIETKIISFIILSILTIVFSQFFLHKVKHSVKIYFTLLILLIPFSTYRFLAISLLSHEWYRGTSRGFQISIIDLMSLSLFIYYLTKVNILYLLKKLATDRCLILYILFIINAVIVSLQSEYFTLSLFELLTTSRSLLLMFVTIIYVSDKKNIRYLLFAFFLSLATQVFIGIFDRYFFGHHRIEAFLGHANNFSMFCLIIGSYSLILIYKLKNQRWKLLSSLSFILALIGIILSISRMGFLAILFAMVLCVFLYTTKYHFMKRRNVVIVILGFSLFSSILFKSADSISSRLLASDITQEFNTENTEYHGRHVYFTYTKYILSEKPYGVGLNKYSKWLSSSKKYGATPFKKKKHAFHSIYAPAHNLFFLTASETGLQGLLLYLLFWSALFFTILKKNITQINHPTAIICQLTFIPLAIIFINNGSEYILREVKLSYIFHMILAIIFTANIIHKEHLAKS